MLTKIRLKNEQKASESNVAYSLGTWLLFPTPAVIKGMGTSFRRNVFWDRLGGQALMIG